MPPGAEYRWAILSGTEQPVVLAAVLTGFSGRCRSGAQRLLRPSVPSRRFVEEWSDRERAGGAKATKTDALREAVRSGYREHPRGPRHCSAPFLARLCTTNFRLGILGPRVVSAPTGCDLEALDRWRGVRDEPSLDDHLDDADPCRRRHARVVVGRSDVERVTDRPDGQPTEHDALHDGVERHLARIAQATGRPTSLGRSGSRAMRGTFRGCAADVRGMSRRTLSAATRRRGRKVPTGTASMSWS